MIFSRQQFFQKPNGRIRLYYCDTSGRHVFIRFLEEIEDTKKTFRNYLTFRICLLRFCHLFCKIVRHNPPWAYLKFLIFGAPVSSRTQRTKVRPWSLTGRQGIQHSYIDPRKWRCTGSVCCLWATYTRKYMVKHQSKGEEKQSCLFHCGESLRIQEDIFS